jgi:hypothetical protein
MDLQVMAALDEARPAIGFDSDWATSSGGRGV